MLQIHKFDEDEARAAAYREAAEHAAAEAAAEQAAAEARAQVLVPELPAHTQNTMTGCAGDDTPWKGTANAAGCRVKVLIASGFESPDCADALTRVAQGAAAAGGHPAPNGTASPQSSTDTLGSAGVDAAPTDMQVCTAWIIAVPQSNLLYLGEVVSTSQDT